MDIKKLIIKYLPLIFYYNLIFCYSKTKYFSWGMMSLNDIYNHLRKKFYFNDFCQIHLLTKCSNIKWPQLKYNPNMWRWRGCTSLNEKEYHCIKFPEFDHLTLIPLHPFNVRSKIISNLSEEITIKCLLTRTNEKLIPPWHQNKKWIDVIHELQPYFVNINDIIKIGDRLEYSNHIWYITHINVPYKNEIG